jgi:hypothetical protein
MSSGEIPPPPEPPDDPDEDAEFEEWTYFEDGKPITVKRPNPRYRRPKPRVCR